MVPREPGGARGTHEGLQSVCEPFGDAWGSEVQSAVPEGLGVCLELQARVHIREQAHASRTSVRDHLLDRRVDRVYARRPVALPQAFAHRKPQRGLPAPSIGVVVPIGDARVARLIHDVRDSQLRVAIDDALVLAPPCWCAHINLVVALVPCHIDFDSTVGARGRVEMERFDG